MVKFQDVQKFLLEQKDQLAGVVANPAKFQRELGNLEKFWQGEDDEALLLKQTWKVMQGYPPVWKALAGAKLVPEQVERDQEQPPVGEAEEPQPQPQAPQPAPKTAVSPPEVSQSTADRLATWSEWVVIGKEIITGCMGLLIVGLTLMVALAAILTVKNAQTQAAVKDVLLFLNGLVGVVLGYYFGRVPGEIQAGKAQSEAKAARTELDTTVAEVATIVEAGRADRDRGGGGGVTLTPDQVERLRQVLRRR